MRSLCSQYALLFALAGTALLGGKLHGWLVEQSRHADLPAAEGAEDSLTLRLNGKERHIRLKNLSAEERVYLQSLTERHSETLSSANFDAPWPADTHMEDRLQVRAVEEDDERGLYIYETAHFRFHSPARLGLSTVSEIGRVFEGTFSACRALPLNFPCRRLNADSGEDGKFTARLFLTREDYAREVGSEHAQTAGLFREPEILVPFESLGMEPTADGYAVVAGERLDSGTLIHELTHQMSLLRLSYDVPIWFAEGIAEYMRMVPCTRGNFHFRAVHRTIIPGVVGGSGTSSRQLGRRLNAPPLEEFLQMSFREFQAARGNRAQFNYGLSALLVYYFIHLDGEGDGARLKRWMSHLQGTEQATAHLSMKIPADSSAKEIATARHQLQQKALSIKEEYYYAPLLDGRNWQELEQELSHKLKNELGITISFNNTPSVPIKP